MEKLKEILVRYVEKLSNRDNNDYQLNDVFLNKLYEVYPFNRFEYVISHLIAKNIIDLQEYKRLRDEYQQRNLFCSEHT